MNLVAPNLGSLRRGRRTDAGTRRSVPLHAPGAPQWVCTILAALLGVLAPSLGAAQITVFAAASLTDSVKEIAAAYAKATGDRIVLNFAASGPLARQIEAGAPADIFFSADVTHVDALESKGLLVQGTRRSRLSNALVVVAEKRSELTLGSVRDLASERVRRLALGETRRVPVGSYARAYLEKLELWAALEPKVIPCDNARAVLAAVESGNVDAGVVYRTDAVRSSRVRIALAIPVEEGPAICYPMALLKDAREPVAARRFLDHLASAEAGQVFKRSGFILLDPPPTP